MLFDLAAWAVILVVALTAGRGALALLRADPPRAGDRFILAVWVGVVVSCVVLLSVSLISPLTPSVSTATAGALVALGALAWWRGAARVGRPAHDHTRLPGWAAGLGVACLLAGAAALASDPVTLYDSLVYHVGVMRWLRQEGIVPGMALVHNRLGHVSAWFTLAAGFDAGPGTNRAANVPLGFALWLVGLQAAIAAARVARRRASVPDWFLGVTSLALIVPVATRGAATPSPDVATNALIAVAAWSLLLVATTDRSIAPPKCRGPLGPRVVPLVLALGACAMKLFAAPAVVATAIYALRARHDGPGPRAYVRRALVGAGLGLAILGPFIGANLIASGCPAYPSPIGCLDAPWSVGASRASDYATYVRDVARWERRGETSVGASLGWLVPWVLAHPVITLLAVLTPVLAFVLLRREGADRAAGNRTLDRAGAFAVIGVAILGTAFAAWQAPAPRFLYAYVVIGPALALSLRLHARASVRSEEPMTPRGFRAAVAFVATAGVIGFAYALASQKLNVRSAVASGAPLVPSRTADLLVPAAPEAPTRLFRWRVNDVELLTPVPRPIADTLGYHSVIGLDTALEKCSTAPLPCTPYLPDQNIGLRRPARGLRGGFARVGEQRFAGRVARCIGELTSARPSLAAHRPPVSSAEDGSRCGDEPPR